MRYKVSKEFTPLSAQRGLYSHVSPATYNVIDIVDGRGILVDFIYMREFIANREVELYGRLIEE